MTCGPKSRSALWLLRSKQSFSGRSRTIATGRQWYCRANSTSGLRASGWTFVASITVSRPSASRFPAMNRSTSNAWFVTVWSFSLSEIMPRQASDERISVGLKWLRAKVLLPEPLGPIRTRRLSFGIDIFMLGELWANNRRLVQQGREVSFHQHQQPDQRSTFPRTLAMLPKLRSERPTDARP